MLIIKNIYNKNFLNLLAFLFLLLIFSIKLNPFDFLKETAFSSQFNSDYDSQNVITWQYARFIDLFPFRDIWYPYSGAFYLKLPFPPDVYYKFVFNFISFSFLILALYNLFNKSILKLYIFIIVLCWCEYSGLINFVPRYCYLYIFFLIFSTSIYVKSRYVLLLSGIYGGLLFILEPNIFLVGILGIITLFFVNFLSINNHFYKNIKIYFK